MPISTVDRILMDQPMELPRNSQLYIDPHYNYRSNTLTNWAEYYGSSGLRTITNSLSKGSFENEGDINWTTTTPDTITVSTAKSHSGNKSARILTNSSTGNLIQHIAFPNGNKIYCCGWALRTSGSASEVLRAYDYYPFSSSWKNALQVVDKVVLNAAPLDTWVFGSLIRDAVDGGISLVVNTSVSSTTEYYVDDIMVIDLTATFGAGNEPTQRQMDDFVKAQGFFVDVKARLDRNPIIVNMVGELGNFPMDSDGDGLADGLSPGGGASEYTFTEGVQRLTAISESAKQFYAEFTSSKTTFTWNTNDVIYFCGWVRAISGTAKLGLYNRKADGSYDTVVSTAISNNEWTFVSIELTVSSKYSTPILYARIAINSASGQSSFVGSGETVEAKEFIVINKTAVFGAGLEYTKAQMDTFVQGKGYFTTSRWFDDRPSISMVGGIWEYSSGGYMIRSNGIDQYMDYRNNSNTDIRTASPSDPLSVFGVFNIDPSYMGSGYIVCVNDSLTADISYGWAYNPDGQLVVFLNGVSRLLSPSGTLLKGKTYFAGFTWDGTTVVAWVNGRPVATGLYSGTLPYRPNFSINRRVGGAYNKGLCGIQLIARTSGDDVENWARRVNIYRRYNIVA